MDLSDPRSLKRKAEDDGDRKPKERVVPQNKFEGSLNTADLVYLEQAKNSFHPSTGPTPASTRSVEIVMRFAEGLPGKVDAVLFHATRLAVNALSYSALCRSAHVGHIHRDDAINVLSSLLEVKPAETVSAIGSNFYDLDPSTIMQALTVSPATYTKLEGICVGEDWLEENHRSLSQLMPVQSRATNIAIMRTFVDADVTLATCPDDVLAICLAFC